MNDISKMLVNAVKNDLTPSLGVTEPGAIAYASAVAARSLGGRVESVSVRLNSGVYKNSFTCAVPGADGSGCALAAALGAVAGDPEKKLLSTENADEDDIKEAKRLVEEGRAKATLSSISSDIFIEANVETANGNATAVVSGRHDRLTLLKVNGTTVLSAEEDEASDTEAFMVSSVSFDEILECVETAEGLEFTDEAVNMNLALCEEGREKGLIPLTLTRCEHELACGKASAELYADLFTCGAIEARVRGAAAPAMALTGSGSHGILATLPVYEAAVFYSPEDIDLRRRALLLSMLVTKYVKELSGLLSTACGCVLAGGTGAALGITYIYAKSSAFSTEPAPDRRERKTMLADALNTMAASVTGMICHGGNTGCSLKASVGVKTAFAAAGMAIEGRGAENVHGILGLTIEDTMRNMGAIARDMLPLEKSIIEIMESRSLRKS